MPRWLATVFLLIPVILVSDHFLHPRQPPPLTRPTNLAVMLVPLFPKQLLCLQLSIQRKNNLFSIYLAVQTALNNSLLVLISSASPFLKNINALYAQHVIAMLFWASLELSKSLWSLTWFMVSFCSSWKSGHHNWPGRTTSYSHYAKSNTVQTLQLAQLLLPSIIVLFLFASCGQLSKECKITRTSSFDTLAFPFVHPVKRDWKHKSIKFFQFAF